MRRIVALIAGVVAFSLGLVSGTLVPAEADTQYLYGSPGNGVMDTRDNSGGFVGFANDKAGNWIRCTYSGYVRSSVANPDTLDVIVTTACDHGFAVDLGPFNSHVYIGVTGATCPAASYEPGHIGQSSNVEINDGGNTTSDLTGYVRVCGPVTNLCVRWTVDNTGWGEGHGCFGLSLGLPSGDPAAAAYLGSGQAACPAWSTLQPWVTTPTAVAVSGGWAWRSTVSVALTGYASGVGTVPVKNYFGTYLDPYMVVDTAGAAVTMTTGEGSSWPVGTYGTWLSASYTAFLSSGGWSSTSSRSMTITGPTHTGTAGSVPLDWQYVGAGTYFSAAQGSDVFTSQGPAPSSAALTVSGSTTRTQLMQYAGHNDPAQCFSWWGTAPWTTTQDHSGKLTPVGPLSYQTSGTPPTSAGCLTDSPPTCTTTPPNIVVNNNGACAGATGTFTCLHPPGDGDGANLCDNDVGCDPTTGKCIFTANDPSTWVAGSLCELVTLGKQDQSLFGTMVELLQEIADRIGSGAASVVVPPSDPNDTGSWNYNLNALSALFAASAVNDWINAATSTVDVSDVAHTCEGPEVDLSALHVPNFTSLHPFESCDGPTATLAPKVHDALLIGAQLAGAWVAVRLVLWSFGMSLVPGSHNGDDS